MSHTPAPWKCEAKEQKFKAAPGGSGLTSAQRQAEMQELRKALAQ